MSLQVVLQAANLSNKTTTTSLNGSFQFAVDPLSLINANVSIPWNQSAAAGALLPNGSLYTAAPVGDYTYKCADTATDVSPPITLSAMVPDNSKPCPASHTSFH